VRAGRDRLAGLTLTLTLTSVLVAGVPASARQADGPLSILNVPFLSQSELLCGGAAAAMVLRYWGERDLAAESFTHLVDRSRGGIPTPALVRDLTARGWEAVAVTGTDALLRAEIERGRPVITLIEDRRRVFHYVVVVAVSPGAIVFHDPARTPFRVLSREQFLRRWEPAGRWMAVVLPPRVSGLAAVHPPASDSSARPLASDSPAVPLAMGSPEAALTTDAIAGRVTAPSSAVIATAVASTAGSAAPRAARCEALVADGVRQARAKNFDAAERVLTSALSCPGPAPLRELAGVRVLQARWPEATDLAAAALREDARDELAWRLLATGRFLQDEFGPALDAWNAVGEPRIDLVGVAGVTRTRSRVVERSLGLSAGDVLTRGDLRRGQRRLSDVPALVSARLGYVPAPGGRAEVRASAVERTLLPSSPISWAALGAAAAVARELKVGTGSIVGGGERVGVEWRYWPGRPRFAVDVQAPTGWTTLPGVWGVTFARERQPFDSSSLPLSDRQTARFSLSSWATGGLRWAARAGLDEWRGRGRFVTVGGGLRSASAGDRLVGVLDVDGWSGERGFATVSASGYFRSSTVREGVVLTGVLGGGTVSAAAPGDLWVAGDTGRARPMLVRAHPLVDDGRLRVERLGRAGVFATGEVQRWWRASRLRVGGAVFADAATTRRRVDRGPMNDVDLGAGLRATVPGMSGVVRVDLAKGLRDGATRLSLVYEP
jgi:hypothetical protein